jgi:DNA-binding MarR family transcriptional regulator
LPEQQSHIHIGTRALILSKHYYGVLTKWLEDLEIDRYYAVLCFIGDNDHCSQQHICDRLAIDKSAMVRVLDYLKSKGYIARGVNPEDRREHYITLTSKGRRQAKKVEAAFERLDRTMFDGLPQGMVRTFGATLELVTERLKSLPSNDLFFNYRKTARQKPKPRKKTK